MKLFVAATFSTTFVIVAGFLIIFPLFIHPQPDNRQQILLSFSVTESEGSVNWCEKLSFFLESHDLSGTVFFTGKVAEEHPECVSFFDYKIDIGSQTFSNINLSTISDYTIQLEEITRGKQAVDAAGKLYSRIFKAPNGAVDDNIYSLLSRSDILADFSYNNQYNMFVDGQFLKFDTIVYNAKNVSSAFILNLEKTTKPLIIQFDNDCSIEMISNFISNLGVESFVFVNASELTNLNLTLRGENNI